MSILFLRFGKFLTIISSNKLSAFLALLFLRFPRCIYCSACWCTLLFSLSVVSNSLQPHGLQHARLPHPSPSPRTCSNSCLLSQWCHPTISFSVTLFSSCPQSGSTRIRVFSNELALSIRWPQYWNFSFCISPSKEYSGPISFRSDWFGLLDIQGTLRSLLQVFSSTTIWKHQSFSS